MDINKVCRLCASKVHKPKNIFAMHGVIDKISKFTDIQIRQGDGLPTSICDLCDTKLRIVDEFRQKTGKADKLIRAFAAVKRNEKSNKSLVKRALRNKTVAQRIGNDFQQQANIRSKISRKRTRRSERSSIRHYTIVSADPLNLLTVKSIQPLAYEDNASFVHDSTSTYRQYRDYQKRKEPAVRKFYIDDSEEEETEQDYSSSESSVSSSGNLFGGLQRASPPGGSTSTLRIDHKSSSPIAATAVNDVSKVVSKPRQSGVQCPICDRILNTTHGLKVHFRIHRSENCPICKAPTGTKDIFRDHIIKFHVKSMQSSTPVLECRICKMGYKTNIGLNMHMRSHTLSVPTVTECPHCKRSFSSSHGFKIHLAKSHSGYETE